MLISKVVLSPQCGDKKPCACHAEIYKTLDGLRAKTAELSRVVLDHGYGSDEVRVRFYFEVPFREMMCISARHVTTLALC